MSPTYTQTYLHRGAKRYLQHLAGWSHALNFRQMKTQRDQTQDLRRILTDCARPQGIAHAWPHFSQSVRRSYYLSALLTDCGAPSRRLCGRMPRIMAVTSRHGPKSCCRDLIALDRPDHGASHTAQRRPQARCWHLEVCGRQSDWDR